QRRTRMQRRENLIRTLGLLILLVGIIASLGMSQDRGGGGGRGGRGGGGGIVTLTVSSTSFQDGGEIPAKYTGQGISPQLSWTGAPAATMSYVLIMHDVDAAIPAG